MKVFVTGGTGTIGAITIKELSQMGYEVFFQYGSNEIMAERIENNCGAKGIKIKFGDELRNVDLHRLGVPSDCDILINCIGAHIVVQNAETVTTEAADMLYKINVEVPFMFIRHMLPYMKLRSFGKIINLSSVCGLKVGENNIPYIISKHALSALTKCIALEYENVGIRCNEICPSAVKSKMNDFILAEEAKIYKIRLEDYIRQEQPDGALEPEAVVNAVLYLLSDSAAMLNGVSLVVDDGSSPYCKEDIRL